MLEDGSRPAPRVREEGDRARPSGGSIVRDPAAVAAALEVLRGEGPDPSARDHDERPSARRTYRRALLVSSVFTVAVMMAGVAIGAVRIPLDEVLGVLGHHLLGRPLDDEIASSTARIVWTIRVPRVLLAAVVGGSLGVAGAVLQVVVRNPLADPYVLGVAEGGSLGAVIVLVYGSGAAAGLGMSSAAFVGALLAIGLAISLGQRAGELSPLRLLLAGVAIGAVLSAATSFVQLRAAPGRLEGVVFWLLGSVAGARWSQLGIPTLVLILTTTWLVLQGRSLNALAVGDEAAAGLGIPVRRLRIELLVASAMLTGVCVAVAGVIGFVGLVIPHACRLVTGVDHRRVLPLCVVVGAGFLVFVDLLARTVEAPAELPLGIFTAAVGGPVFVWLLRRNDAAGITS